MAPFSLLNGQRPGPLMDRARRRWFSLGMRGIRSAPLARCLALAAGLLVLMALPAIARAAPATTVSLTFDDGNTNQYANALPALTAHGMNGTFFINPAHISGNSEYMTW